MPSQLLQHLDCPSQNIPQQNILHAEFQPIVVSVKTASKLLSVSERTVWDLIREGLLSSMRIGSRVLVVYEDILDFVRQNADKSGKLVRPDRSNALASLNRSRSKANLKDDGGVK